MTNVHLDASRLDALGLLAWLQLLEVVRRNSTTTISLTLSGVNHIVPETSSFEAGIYRAGVEADLSVSATVFTHEVTENFAFISDSKTLSVKLLRGLPRIFICPNSVPCEMNAGLYWLLLAQTDLQQHTQELIHHVGLMHLKAEPDWFGKLSLSPRRVSLISSVFAGDFELPLFLENMSRLEGYENDEHFLIRAGSPGDEHEQLTEYVANHPSSIYVNLVKDPGLYDTWNLGGRLANGRYLSNANLDDRRAPEQLQLLTLELEMNKEVACVSTALRISEDPSMRWEDSSQQPLMYGDVSSQVYGENELVKKAAQGYRSRNLPHCMPVWKRTLHAKHGWFNEGLYGPSADWEFWLRCCRSGERLSFLDKPLGLYRISQGSYWHRDPRSSEFDDRVISHHLSCVSGLSMGNGAALKPLRASRFRDLKVNWKVGAAYESLCSLIWFSHQVVSEDCETSVRDLIDTFVHQRLCIPGFSQLDLANSHQLKKAGLTADQVLQATVELVHAVPVGARNKWGRAPDWQLLSVAFDDLEQVLTEYTPKFLRALVLRKQKRLDSEKRLLRFLFSSLGAKQFWHYIQRAYRFTVSITELASIVGVCQVSSSGNRPIPKRLWFYPYYRSNAYQDLIYAPFERSGCEVFGIEPSNLSDICKLQKWGGEKTVLHLHWLNAFFKGLSADAYPSQINELKQMCRYLREQGVELWWTIHNRVSHQCVNSLEEIAFRKWLATFVDRLYVQHPLALELLDWLPDDVTPDIWEHPSYPIQPLSFEKRKMLRRSLGVNGDEKLIITFGKIEKYKGMAESLPTLVNAVKSSSRFKLLIAGKLLDPEVETFLHNLPSDERLVIKTERLPDEALNNWLQAADIGVLFYQDILTSGTLFHMLSAGLKVWSPKLGTLPAYVVPGLNGEIYDSPAELVSFLAKE